MIEIRELRVSFGSVEAVAGIDLTAYAGQATALLGRNGAGKSSLLAVLAGYRRESGGTVRIGGQPVFENAAVTGQVCLIRGTGDAAPQSLKVADVLRFAELLRPRWDAEYAAELLDGFRVPLNRTTGSLSHGKQCALGITIGLASRAPLTLFDESYLGLDAPSRYRFYDELLADVMANPRTVVLSTHLIEEVSALFEEVLILDEGRLVLHEEAETLRGAGSAVTGDAELVDRFVDGLRVLGAKELGRTKSAMVFGELDDEWRGRARAAGLDLGPLALQDLFVHLTEPSGERS